MRGKLSNEDLAKCIISRCIRYLSENGELVDASGCEGKPTIATFGALEMLYTSPFTKARGTPGSYGLDIWAASGHTKRKVFSVWWDPIDLVTFKKGPWVDEILRLPD